MFNMKLQLQIFPSNSIKAHQMYTSSLLNVNKTRPFDIYVFLCMTIFLDSDLLPGNQLTLEEMKLSPAKK